MNKLPNPEDILYSYFKMLDKEIPKGRILNAEMKGQLVIEAMRFYGRQVRDNTLELVSEEIELIDYSGNKHGKSALQFSKGNSFIVGINKDSILNLKNDERLKI